MSGYYGKRLDWDKEDKELIVAGKHLPFFEIKVRRARHFLRARSKGIKMKTTS